MENNLRKELLPNSTLFNDGTLSTVTDFEGIVRNTQPNEARFNGARRWENLAIGNLTQTITLITGREYHVTVGAGSTAGATVVLSGGLTGTITADGTNRLALSSDGTPTPATSNSVTLTVSDSISELFVEDVTGQTNQNPSDYVAGGYTLNQHGLFSVATKASSVSPTISLLFGAPNYEWSYSDGTVINNNISGSHTFSPNLSTNAFSLGDATLAPYIRVLRLHNNQLTSSIPSLSALVNLQVLLAHNNLLTGSIPNLDFLVEAKILYLRNNKLTGSIPSLSSLSNLTEFYAERNKLTSFLSGAVSPSILIFDVSINNLSVSAVNDLLVAFDNAGSTTLNFNSSGGTNAAPTGAGLIAKNNMISRGLTVVTN